MKNNQDVNSQLIRMRNLMKYGIDESKKTPYTGVEYEKENGGKLYGIVREGTKYYIKVSPNKKGKLAENYEYIGGFRNRKDNEYSSFADAQKNFDLKMMSINEANTPDKKIVVESWNPDKQEELTVESTDRLKREISRERQIMLNASRINEKKEQNLKPINEKKDGVCPKCGNSPCTCDSKACGEKEGYDFKDAQNPKNSFRPAKHEEGDAKKANKGYKTVKATNESAEPLAWHSTGKDAAGNIADTYMDKSRGTKVGSSAPFDDKTAQNIDGNQKPVTDTSDMKNGVVESVAMHDEGENQNSPKPGVGEVGDDAPFDGEKGKDITEDIDDIDSDADVEDDDASLPDDTTDGDDTDFDDTDTDGDDFGADDDTEGFGDDTDTDDLGDTDDDFDDTDDDSDVNPDIADMQDQISALNDKLDAIMDAVGADEPTVDTDKYTDDDLYDDDDTDSDDDSDLEDCVAYESRSYGNRPYVFESAAYKRLMMNEAKKARRAHRINEGDAPKPFSDGGRVPSGNMNTLHDFGKHPAYQKKVMTLPNKDMQEFPDYYDMNDDSVKSDAPYGEKIGSSAPFVVDPEEMENAIAESIKRHLGKLIR